MHIKSIQLASGRTLAIAIGKHVKVFYGNNKEKDFENLVQLSKWVRHKYNEELVL